MNIDPGVPISIAWARRDFVPNVYVKLSTHWSGVVDIGAIYYSGREAIGNLLIYRQSISLWMKA